MISNYGVIAEVCAARDTWDTFCTLFEILGRWVIGADILGVDVHLNVNAAGVWHSCQRKLLSCDRTFIFADHPSHLLGWHIGQGGNPITRQSRRFEGYVGHVLCICQKSVWLSWSYLEKESCGHNQKNIVHGAIIVFRLCRVMRFNKKSIYCLRPGLSRGFQTQAVLEALRYGVARFLL